MYFHSHKIHFEPLIIVCLIWFWYSMCILKVSSAHIAYTFFLLSPKSLGGLSGPSFHSPSHNGWEYEKEKKKSNVELNDMCLLYQVLSSDWLTAAISCMVSFPRWSQNARTSYFSMIYSCYSVTRKSESLILIFPSVTLSQ